MRIIFVFLWKNGLMRVITLNESEFVATCTRLQEEVVGRFVPDLVVGIANGGVHVARNMFAEVPQVSVERRRPSTSRKPRRMFGRLPYFVTDILRMLESVAFSARKPSTSILPAIGEETSAAIGKARSILIVDDSVDSGVTMSVVVDAVKEAVRPGAKIKTAAITVTTKNPVIRPDFCLYDDRTLIRFPWSRDYRNDD